MIPDPCPSLQSITQLSPVVENVAQPPTDSPTELKTESVKEIGEHPVEENEFDEFLQDVAEWL